jgi:hypothetical protein
VILSLGIALLIALGTVVALRDAHRAGVRLNHREHDRRDR